MQFLHGIYSYLPSISTSSGRMCVLSCPTLCDLMNRSPPGPSVHGIFRIRILQWVANCSSRGSSPPRYQTCVSCISRWILYHWATTEALEERDPHTLSMGIYIGTVTVKNSLWKPEKKQWRKLSLGCDIPTPGSTSQENHSWKRHMHPNIHYSTT